MSEIRRKLVIVGDGACGAFLRPRVRSLNAQNTNVFHFVLYFPSTTTYGCSRIISLDCALATSTAFNLQRMLLIKPSLNYYLL